MSGLMRSLEDSDDARAECEVVVDVYGRPVRYEYVRDARPPQVLGYAVVDVHGQGVPLPATVFLAPDLEHARKAAAAWNRARRRVVVVALVEVPDARQ